MPNGTSVEHVDAIVVGSGFGGAVAAYRLAESGRSVIVLERGQAYPPGSFARSPHEMARAFWEPKDDLYGLFDVRSFRKLEAIVSSGLGGGSLIYANVLLRKDERWFVHDSPLPGGGYEHWPIGRADLDPHYDAVERMLRPTPNPYPDLPKAQALRDAARQLGLSVSSPPLAISFSAQEGVDASPKQVLPLPEYGNLHGLTRLSCRLCGECDIGCNEGSKNTLDHTYLSAAVYHGAEIRTLAEARGITPLPGGGYEVRYLQYGADPDADGKRPATEVVLRGDQLVLGAGTFGTTTLLLRNRVSLPALGRALGHRFSGNGDLLTFAMGARGEGPAGPTTRIIDGARGPVITTTIRVPDGVDEDGVERGFYVQEAGFPEFANWLVETTQMTSSVQRAAAVARDLLAYRLHRRNESTISAEVSRLVGHGKLTSSALPLLGMGRDVPDGRLTLRDGELDIDWTTATSLAYFTRMRDTMRAISDALGARFHDNPLWWTKRIVTVHPLGGAPMGRHVHEGVCDDHGEAFGHPGLWVVDGSLMPGPVGPNPALTIAALADRAADRMVGRPRSNPARAAERRATVVQPDDDPLVGRSVQFTEQMKGHFALGESDPVTGWRLGQQLRHALMFELTIMIPDVDRFLASEGRAGTASGYVGCDVLGGHRPVQRGWFNLFVATPHARTREMRYRLWFTDQGGNPITLYGFKTVRNDPGMDMWQDTSTLYVTLLAGHVPPGDAAGGPGEPAEGEEPPQVVGAGVLRILVRDFAKQLTTFRAQGQRPVRAVAEFGRHFAGSLRDIYLRPPERTDR